MPHAIRKSRGLRETSSLVILTGKRFIKPVDLYIQREKEMMIYTIKYVCSKFVIKTSRTRDALNCRSPSYNLPRIDASEFLHLLLSFMCISHIYILYNMNPVHHGMVPDFLTHPQYYPENWNNRFNRYKQADRFERTYTFLPKYT